jgi:hypothetical protein
VNLPISLSYGGGIQSVSLLVLVAEGILPRPTWTVIADTGREKRTTWEYMNNVMQPYLDRKGTGIKIEVAPHTLATKDLYGPTGLTLMPMYTREGRLPAYCSGHWKRDVIERWLRLQGVESCEQWLGFSWDEKHRRKENHRQWVRNVFPLCDRHITRDGCKLIIEKAGLPLPSKSRCYQCPHMTPEEWLEVKASPEEFAAAMALEKRINENDPEQAGLFLYSGRVPLEMADFQKDIPEFPPLFRACEGGNCFT